ncbi:hypothetical protein BJ742DRAFT_840044, partial [Cladochytrium replicatum]
MGLAMDGRSLSPPAVEAPETIPSLAATSAVVFFDILQSRANKLQARFQREAVAISGTRRKHFRQFCERLFLSTVTVTAFLGFDRKGSSGLDGQDDSLDKAFKKSSARRSSDSEAMIANRLTESMLMVSTLAMIALKYVDRFITSSQCTKNSGELFDQRVFTSAFVLAQKMYGHEDHVLTNSCWSEATGFEPSQLLDMEVEFLLAVDFNLRMDDVDAWRSEITSTVAWYSSTLRLGSGASVSSRGNVVTVEGATRMLVNHTSRGAALKKDCQVPIKPTSAINEGSSG